MSIFSSILAKILPGAAEATKPEISGTPESGVPAVTAAVGAPGPAAIALVDVEALLDGVPGAKSLAWRTSIVDLLKLLGLDSSLEARKQLARELSYSEDMKDSAKMNVWLHRQVMSQLAANGGKVPAALLA